MDTKNEKENELVMVKKCVIRELYNVEILTTSENGNSRSIHVRNKIIIITKLIII